jgi:hypothetical protein
MYVGISVLNASAVFAINARAEPLLNCNKTAKCRQVKSFPNPIYCLSAGFMTLMRSCITSNQ